MTYQEALKEKGILIKEDYGYFVIATYNCLDLCILCNNSLSNTFALNINDEQICTRCNFRTLIQKIKTYK